MHNLQTLKRRIIERGYPELERIVIGMNYASIKDALTEYVFTAKKWNVYIDNSLQNAALDVVTGGLAHEFAHITRDLSRGIIPDIIDTLIYHVLGKYEIMGDKRYDHIGYFICQWYVTKDERGTDRLAIHRGFGKELLAFAVHADNRYEAYNGLDGLTTREIRKEMQEHHALTRSTR